MSAIAGIINLDGRPVEPALIETMIDTVAHRGTDGRGVWIQGSVALAHRANWTTPEAAVESLPMEFGDRLVMTGDVRLDNRKELLDSLSGCSRLSEAAPDCALVLAAYEKWDESCVDHFLGDFAFAIWDRRARELFCARDHMGIRPFYFAVLPSRQFVFGTEIKAVLSVPGIADTINEQKVADEFVHLIKDPASTYYQHVSRLPPAHSLTVANAVATRKYWSLNPERELHLNSDREYAEGFYEHFSRAVQCRLRNSHPVGSMLSGGLDSSSISCVARDTLKAQGKPKLHTFSAVFDEVKECDERSYIQTVLAKGRCDPNFIVLDRLSPLSEADSLLWHLDEPYAAGNLYLSWNAYREASDLGVRVILDGFDGDNVVSHGLGRLVELAAAGRWWRLAMELRSGSAHLNVDSWLGCWWQWLCKYQPMAARANRLGSGVARRLRRSTPSAPPAMETTGILNSDLARRHGFRQLARTSSRPYKNERERHLQQLTTEGIPRTFEILSHTAAAFGVEVRFPFMDIRLIKYCLSLPSDQKMRGGFTRVVMRNGMTGVLPDQIRRRGGKSNLAPSFEKGLFKFERDNLRSIILDEASQLGTFLDLKQITECLDRFGIQQASESDINILWNAANLALWLRNRLANVEPSILQRTR